MGKKLEQKVRVPDKLQAWLDARKRHHLSDAHVQMARELGMNPKRLGKMDNHKQEPWKAALPEFIEHLYQKRFGRLRPERVVSIERKAQDEAAKKQAKRESKAVRREADATSSKPAALSAGSGAAPSGRPGPARARAGSERQPEDANEADGAEADLACDEFDDEEDEENGDDDVDERDEEFDSASEEEEIEARDYFEDYNLDDPHDLGQLVEDFIDDLEEGTFALWEAVRLREQGRPLTRFQRELLADLISFDDEPDEPIVCIDELPRPDRPWHELLLEIARRLLSKPLSTKDCLEGVFTRGWPQLVAALAENGQGLPLPVGMRDPIEVVPAELRHELWFQSCLDALIGLGQQETWTLEDPAQHCRIADFIENLRLCRESVRALGVTLENLPSRVAVPARDRPILVRLLAEALGLESPTLPLADRL